MSGPEYDLIVSAGRLFCNATGLDGPGAVAVRGDRIVDSGPDVSGTAGEELDFPDALLVPGFVDMHSHPAPAHWKYGVAADDEILSRGSTTILSQGDAGAANWDQYVAEIIEPSRTRILMAISPALNGEAGAGPVFAALEDVNVDECVAAVERGGRYVWGIAVNISDAATGDNDPREVMRRTLTIAERTGRPLLYGARRSEQEWSLSDQLDVLRPGDVVTYCFHKDGGLLDAGGRVAPEVLRAREKGVLFDVGHGMASFDFSVAESAIADGFLPDTISTDVYKRHVRAIPTHDMPRTLSKLLAAGMSESEALARATAAPSAALGLEGEVGTLAAGACADLAVIRWSEDAPALVDVTGASRPGGCWEPEATIRAGRVVPRNA